MNEHATVLNLPSNDPAPLFTWHHEKRLARWESLASDHRDFLTPNLFGGKLRVWAWLSGASEAEMPDVA